MGETAIISALGGALATLAGVVVALAKHIRDLNRLLTERSDSAAAESARLAERWRRDTAELREAHKGELVAILERQSELLVGTNRTLDAIFDRARRLSEDNPDPDQP